MSLGAFDLLARLHWTVLWVAAPLCLLVAIDATTRTDFSAAWRRATHVGIALGGLALLAMLARIALARWQLGAGWIFLPLLLLATCLAARAGGLLTFAVLFFVSAAVPLMAWVVLSLQWLFGAAIVIAINNAMLIFAALLLGAAIARHLSTKRPPAAAASPAAEAAREAEVQQQLSDPRAQEGADKYTRE